MSNNTFARVHRFRDCVAFDTDEMDQTAYLTAGQAQKLASALLEYAADCNSVKFTDSRLSTLNLEVNSND